MVQRHNSEQDPEIKDSPLSGTRKGKQPKPDDYIDNKNLQSDIKEGDANSLKECPGCRYPLIPGALNCPECSMVFESSVKPNGVNEAGMGNSDSKEDTFSGTIDPWRQKVVMDHYLRPIPRKGEKPMPLVKLGKDENQLNRSILEKENHTLTSRVQATISKIDGKWYLVDNSSKQTTFILASKPIEIQVGDIILMGDRKFEFGI